MESLTFIIIAVIITSIGFLIGYQMIRLQKNVAKIVDQIIEHHKGDRSFRDKEFIHYFKAGGNIWLSAMDDKFKKMLSMQKYTAMAAMAVAVVIIALSIVQNVYLLAAYPVLLILFLGKNLLDFKSVASDDKTNSRNAVEYYKKAYPEDASAKSSGEGKTADKLAGWFLIAKRTAIRTGKLGTGSKAAASQGEEVRPSRAIRRGSPGRTIQRRRGRR